MQKSHGGICIEGYGEKSGGCGPVYHCLCCHQPGGAGQSCLSPARRELNRHGIRCDGKFARQITREDLQKYDYIYYMDSRNLRYLRQMFPDFDGFLPFLDRDVADPWYSGDFTQTWADVTEGCARILEELQ